MFTGLEHNQVIQADPVPEGPVSAVKCLTDFSNQMITQKYNYIVSP